MNDKPMTRSDRDSLLSLVKKREKVMKAMVDQRGAAMLAEFEKQAAARHDFNRDDVWKEATLRAKAAAEDAARIIAARCAELGIPEEFAPTVSFYWHGRGEGAVKDRQAELRREAKARIESLKTQALAKIEQMSLAAQTGLLSQSLETNAAKLFLSEMDRIDTLLPALEFDAVSTAIEERKRAHRSLFDS